MRSHPVVIAAVVAALCATVGAQPHKTERIVLVTLDGARWQDVFTGLDESVLRQATPKDVEVRNTAAYRRFWAPSAAERRERLMPFLWRTVAREGVIAGDRSRGSAVSVANAHRLSYPGYSEMLTGQAHDDVITSNEAIRNQYPSVLQFVRRELHLPAAKVATFASWGVFSSIVESAPGETTVNAGLQPYASPSAPVKLLSYLQQETPVPWENIRHDAYTFAFAMDYLTREQPVVLLLGLDEMDDWAHDGKYDLALDAMHRADAYLETLWAALQNDPNYRDRTTLIVTTDHGRGRSGDGWRRHGASVDGADEVWIAVLSPDVALRGEWTPSAPLFQNQIAATIAGLLGLDYRTQNPDAGLPIAFTAK